MHDPAAGQPTGAGLHVLVVDDERNIRTTLEVCLRGIGCEVTLAATADEARRAVERAAFDLAFVDLRLADQSGLDLLPDLRATRHAMTIVIVTAFASIDTAVEAIKRGASEYLPKPFTPHQIRHLVARVAESRVTQSRLETLHARLAAEIPEADLRSGSAAMRAALDVVLRAAAADAPVLLRGESGTGKGVLAAALHSQSPRAERPFVTVNCPTLTGDLLASELFGHARGSFTGAVRDQPGRVEIAEGGTLFLDEIGEILPPLQAKLLRFLQDKKFERLGDTRTRTANVRVVAATNRDLDADVRDGRFREDLLYRLNVIEVVVPPLRERGDDLERLAQGFLGFFARRLGRPVPVLTPDALAAMRAYAWPGNVRELRNAMERAVILQAGATIEASALPARIAPPPLPATEPLTLDDVERAHILKILAEGHTMEEAARILGIDDSTLWRKRKRFGI